MATSKEYMEFIKSQLIGAGDIALRPMMGEYILYYRGKVAGGIYDDRLLVKSVSSAEGYLDNVIYEIPYEGAKPMLLIDNVDDPEYLRGLLEAMYDELPAPKPKKKR